MATEWLITAQEAGQRVDTLVSDRAKISRADARRLIADGAVLVEGRRAKKGDRLAAGQTVVLSASVPTAEERAPRPEPDAPLELLYEDAHLVAIAKPAGIPSHPLRPGETGTLANRLCARFPECARAGEDPREGGLAHRLDAGTTGVLLAARTRASWLALRESFRAGAAQKHYLALVAAEPLLDTGAIAAPLESRGRRSVVDAGGREAVTEWRVIERFAARHWTLLGATTRTGRLHQVRAHFAYAELPIVGDTLYGGPPCDGLVGHFLHAQRLVIPHPAGERSIDIQAPLPAERQRLLASLQPSARVPEQGGPS